MSERRERRRIERTAGTGTVTLGGVALGSATYVMEVWQTFHIPRAFGDGGGEVAGLKELKITLIRHDLDSFKLWQERVTLTLHFEDGRRLDGFLDEDEFVASGQLTAA